MLSFLLWLPVLFLCWLDLADIGAVSADLAAATTSADRRRWRGSGLLVAARHRHAAGPYSARQSEPVKSSLCSI